MRLPGNSWPCWKSAAVIRMPPRKCSAGCRRTRLLRSGCAAAPVPCLAASAALLPARPVDEPMKPKTTTLPPSSRLLLARRAALLGPLALLSGCGLWDDWMGKDKPPLPGHREAIGGNGGGLDIENVTPGTVVVPPAMRNPSWPTPGGNTAHVTGNLEAADQLTRAWSSSIGSGGGYRRKNLAQP